VSDERCRLSGTVEVHPPGERRVCFQDDGGIAGRDPSGDGGGEVMRAGRCGEYGGNLPVVQRVCSDSDLIDAKGERELLGWPAEERFHAEIHVGDRRLFRAAATREQDGEDHERRSHDLV
jgi:hypothetical protein